MMLLDLERWFMKKPQDNNFQYPDDNRIRIKKEDIKIREGHLEHDKGCGRHDDRPRRKRTRQTQKRDWLDGN